MRNRYQKFILIYLLFLFVYWIALQISGLQISNYNFGYSFLFSLVPLIGGVLGMVKSKIWGRLKSTLGKGIFFTSFGLFLWGSGSMVWSYYNFVEQIAAPYPSLADFGFAPSIFFWIIGSWYLAKASGAFYALKKNRLAQIFASLSFVGLSTLAYYMLVIVARGGVVVPEGETPLKVVLDIAYPLGDFLALVLAFLVYTLSSKYLGGLYKSAIASILIGLGIMYFADFSFSYTTTNGTFFVGSWVDLLLTLGLFFMTFGILGFSTKPQSKIPNKHEDQK